MPRRAVLLAILATLSCRRPTLVDPALAALVPADTVFLAGLRADALRDTSAYKKWLAPALREFACDAGLELPAELWQVLVASDGARLLVLARGKFDEPKLQHPGARYTAYKGYTLIGDERAAAVFMNTSTAAAGPPAALRALIDQRDRGGNSALLQHAEALPAEAQIWAVSLALPAPPPGLPGNLRRIAPMLESFTGHADLRDGLKLAIDAQCRTVESARSLNDALATLRALAGLAARNDPALQQAYDAVHIELSGRTVRVNAGLPQDLLDRLAASR